MKTSNSGTFLHAEWEVVHTTTSSTYMIIQTFSRKNLQKSTNTIIILDTEHWWYNEETLRHLEVQLSTCTIRLHQFQWLSMSTFWTYWSSFVSIACNICWTLCWHANPTLMAKMEFWIILTFTIKLCGSWILSVWKGCRLEGCRLGGFTNWYKCNQLALFYN
jgi:hypothetical protein